MGLLKCASRLTVFFVLWIGVALKNRSRACTKYDLSRVDVNAVAKADLPD